ncbi:HSP20-like chaperone [Spinellus fusiger]|nr:HSP20-like chaperone [Spinellus fusiger]
MSLHPTILWAQSDEVIFLTVELSDVKSPVIDIQPTKFSFKGKGDKEQKEYEAEIEFYSEVETTTVKQSLTARNVFLIIRKKGDEGIFWPKLQKGNKLNFVKVDFARWRDEDDEVDEAIDNAAMNNMSDMGGMGGMEGLGGMGGMGGIDFSKFMPSNTSETFADGSDDESSDEEGRAGKSSA